MTTKFICDICHCEKDMADFYRHSHKQSPPTYRSHYTYTAAGTGTGSIFQGIRPQANVVDERFLTFENEEFRITISIFDKNGIRDICKSCATAIAQRLFAEQVVNKL